MISPKTRMSSRWSGGQPSADAELLSRWCEGDAVALEELIRRHGGMVLGVCRRVLGRHADAEDAFQATFLVFVRKVHTLARPAEVAAWLHQVSLRVARKTLANRSLRQGREGMAVDVADPRSPDPAEGSNDLRRVLDEELDRLPEKYRLPIVLCELEERTLEEAGHILGWPKGTVACRLSRGRELLRQRLTRRGLAPLMYFLPSYLPGAGREPVPDQLVSETLSNVRSASPTSADRTDSPRMRRHLIALLIALFASGSALAVPGWYLQAARNSTPVEPKSLSTAPVGGCHSAPVTSQAGGCSVGHP